MLSPTVFAAILAAIPSALAQPNSNSTSYFTRCTTRFGYYPLPTGTAGVPTWYTFFNATNTFIATVTSQDTITVTPNATICGGTVTETTTATTTSTLTPPAVTVPARSNQLPLLLVNPTAAINPTPIPRIKRLQVDSDLEVNHLINRQTKEGNTGGFIVNPDGSVSYLNKIYPHRILCEKRRIVDTTSTITVSGAPTTTVLPPGTATAMTTITVTTTVTVTETAPTPRVWEACRGNNLVNSITDNDGNRMNFDRVIYRPNEGFPITNQLVVNTTNPYQCCGACQDFPNCAGSFYAPSVNQCILRLTGPAPNSTFPTLPSGSGAPSGSGTTLLTALPSATATPGSCARGSDTLYLGRIRGRTPSELRNEYALYFSNGPCGRFTVNINPIRQRPGIGQQARSR